MVKTAPVGSRRSPAKHPYLTSQRAGGSSLASSKAAPVAEINYSPTPLEKPFPGEEEIEAMSLEECAQLSEYLADLVKSGHSLAALAGRLANDSPEEEAKVSAMAEMTDEERHMYRRHNMGALLLPKIDWNTAKVLGPESGPASYNDAGLESVRRLFNDRSLTMENFYWISQEPAYRIVLSALRKVIGKENHHQYLRVEGYNAVELKLCRIYYSSVRTRVNQLFSESQSTSDPSLPNHQTQRKEISRNLNQLLVRCQLLDINESQCSKDIATADHSTN
jgi:hypothetical protein